MDTTLYIEDSTLTELNEIPDYIERLIIRNEPYLASVPKLPKSLKHLHIENAPITELPTLPKSLKFLFVYNTYITKLPKLPTSLIHIEVPYNQIREFPIVGNSLESLSINNNNIETFPSSFKNLDSLRIENNPGSLQYYKVAKLNKNNISNKNGIPTLTLKKGTVLFHNMNKMENIYDMYLGIKAGDSYVMNFNSQVYFFSQPFYSVSSYGTITTVCVLQNDVKVILGIKPSKLMKQDITGYNEYFTRENCKDTLSFLKSFYGCPGKDIIKTNILGWITHDISFDKPLAWHSESKHFLKYYKYVSYYENKDDIIDRPEIMMHPYKRRLTEDAITPISEAFEVDDKTWLDKNEHKFNYKIIEIIEDNQDFKSYKNVIDSFLSKAGHNGYHMFRNEKDGFYMVREFM